MELDTLHINKARVLYYGLFASLFTFSMDEDDFRFGYQAVTLLAEHPMDEESNRALKYLRRRLANAGYAGLREEVDLVLSNPVTAFIPVTASYYLEGRDDGGKRVEMAEYLLQSKYRKNDQQYRENEDHIGFIFLFIQRLLLEQLDGGEMDGHLARKVFTNTLNLFIDDFCDNLFDHKESRLFKAVAVLMRSFFAFERLYYQVEAPPEPASLGGRPMVQREKKRTEHKCV